MKHPTTKNLAQLLAQPLSRKQDELLLEWLSQRLRLLGAVRHLFGRAGTTHPDFEDVRSRVLAQLLRPVPAADGQTAFQVALTFHASDELDTRATAVLVKTLYQEYHRFLRERNPAFARIREQLRYAIRRHGQRYGITLTVRGPGQPECALRTTFHRRKAARLPQADDLRPHIAYKLLTARGAAKLNELDSLLSALEAQPELQPLVPLNLLATLLANLSDTGYRHEIAEANESSDRELERSEQITRALQHTAHWLTTRYFHKIQADPPTRDRLLRLLHDYAIRFANSPNRRTASKDIVLLLGLACDANSYEQSKLRAHVQYICARFRRALCGFQ